MVSPQNNLKTQADLCKEIAQSIGDKFDAYAFLEKYPRVPSLIKVVILRDIIASASGLDNVGQYAEKIIRQAVRPEVLENGNQAPTRSLDLLGLEKKVGEPPTSLPEVQQKDDPSAGNPPEILRPSPGPLPFERGKAKESQLPTQNDFTLPIPGGYILLARKLLSSDVMKAPPLVLKLWPWTLLQASFKDHGDLKRGQFFTRLKDIQKAMSYKAGFRLIKPTIKEIRGAMKILMKGQMIGTMKVTHGQVITIQNYDFYQNPKNYEGHDEGQSQGHNEGTIPIRKDRKKGKTPSEISDEISTLVSKLFPSPGEKELFYQVGEAISSIRKTGKVSPSIILSQLRAWEKYPIDQVHAGIRTYLSKTYYSPENGKRGEKYLLGIIRNSAQEKKTLQESKSSGSSLLDAYYRKQGGKEKAPREGQPVGSGSPLFDRAMEDFHGGRLKLKEIPK